MNQKKDLIKVLTEFVNSQSCIENKEEFCKKLVEFILKKIYTAQDLINDLKDCVSIYELEEDEEDEYENGSFKRLYSDNILEAVSWESIEELAQQHNLYIW